MNDVLNFTTFQLFQCLAEVYEGWSIHRFDLARACRNRSHQRQNPASEVPRSRLTNGVTSQVRISTSAFGLLGRAGTGRALPEPIPKLASSSTIFSLDDNPVRPLHNRDKDWRTAEFCSPLIQVRLRDVAGTGAGSAGINRNMFCDNICKCLAQWRPANWKNRVHRGPSHQRRGVRE